MDWSQLFAFSGEHVCSTIDGPDDVKTQLVLGQNTTYGYKRASASVYGTHIYIHFYSFCFICLSLYLYSNLKQMMSKDVSADTGSIYMEY